MAINGLSEVREKAVQGQNRAQIINYLSSILLLLVLTWAALSWWNSRVTISDVRVVGESALCPGDLLIVAYNFHVNGAGKLVHDATLWNLDPPKTLVYSTSEPFLLEGPTDQEVIEAWPVPQRFMDRSIAQVVSLPPGEYRRMFAISSPSRSSMFAMEGVNFSVKEKELCPE